MVKNSSTFENLVAEISTGERQALLDKLSDSGEGLNSLAGSLAEEDLLSAKPVDLITQLKSESFLTRLICKIMSVFSGKKPEQVYSDKLVIRLGSSISKKCPNLIDTRRKCLLTSSYSEFTSLVTASKFFQEILAASIADRGGFYLVMGSVLLPRLHSQLLADIDPFTNNIDSSKAQSNEQRTDLKTSYIRKMEQEFKNIGETDKAEMYTTVRASDWLRRFSRLPFDKIVHKYTPFGDSEMICDISSISELLSQCASVLCFTRDVKVNLLEAFFFFNNKSRIENDVCDTDEELTAFISKAKEQLSKIRFFLNKIPVLDLTKYSLSDICFSPKTTENVEDWFVQYKTAWKKRFDSLWSLWLRKKKQEDVKHRMREYLGMEKLPVLENRPWKEIRESLFFRREFTVTFIKGFFASVYPQIMFKPLKSVMAEGEFLRRENQQEFTDAYNCLSHMAESIQNFENRLSSKGDFGVTFEQIRKEKLSTMSGKNRLDTLMLSVDAEGASLVSEVAKAFRSIFSILEGIFARARTGEYQGLTNLNNIDGNSNELFRKKLLQVKEKVVQGLDLIKDLETIELEIS